MKSKSEVFTPTEIENILVLKNRAAELMHSHIPASMAEIGILAGGCFASWYQSVPPKDHDIFLLDNPETHYFIEGALKNLPIKSKRIRPNYSKNPNITYIYEMEGSPPHKLKIQLIVTKYKTREELMEHFDYAHTKISYKKTSLDHPEGTLYTNKETIEAIMTKTLIPMEKAFTSDERKQKFLDRGWKEKKVGLSSSFNGPYANVTLNPIYGSFVINRSFVINPGTGYNRTPEKDELAVNIQVEQEYQQMVQKMLQKPMVMEQLPPTKIEPKERPTPSWLTNMRKALAKPWDN